MALGVLVSVGAAAPACAELRAVGTFDAPVDIVAPLHEDHLLFVVERAGRMRVVRDGTVLAQPFLDITRSSARPARAACSRRLPAPLLGDGALRRLLRRPCRLDPARRVPALAAIPELADPLSARPILTIPHPTYSNHYGGSMAFGPDGLLYVGTGDGGGGGDPFGNAQNLGSLLGKLLRIDPFGGDPYAIPPGNPFVGQAGARPEIFAYGLRNPWRSRFDRATGDLVIGDVGQARREEVDYRAGAAPRRAQLRLERVRGLAPVQRRARAGAVSPVLEYPHAGAACSITGGVVVRDAALGDLPGGYVYGDWCTGTVRSAVLGRPAATDDGDTGLDVPQLVSFGEDAGGCVYAVSLAGTVSPPRRAAGRPRPSLPRRSRRETTITSAPSSPAPASASVRVRLVRGRLDLRVPARRRPLERVLVAGRLRARPRAAHVFEVRATDPGGTVDPTPAQSSVTVVA